MVDRGDEQAGRAVILAGGWMHPPDQPVAALTEVLAGAGLRCDVITDAERIGDGLDPRPDLVAVAACWFSMADSRYDDSQRARWAVSRDESRERQLVALAEAGLPLLALHTAVICFDGWGEWARWLGGAWDWDTSFHPPPSELSVVPVPDSGFSIQPFTVVDEEYQGLSIDPVARVVARSQAGNPLVWLRDGECRAAVDVLGHDHRSLDHPAHRRLLADLVAWLIDRGGDWGPTR